MFVNLPVEVADPAEQLSVVMERTAEQKSQGVATGTDAVVRLADHIPAPLLARASRKYVLAGQRRVNVAATNVPGPREVRHLCGRPLLEFVPVHPRGAGRALHVRPGVLRRPPDDRDHRGCRRTARPGSARGIRRAVAVRAGRRIAARASPSHLRQSDLRQGTSRSPQCTAPVAQGIERWFPKPQAAGSNPAGGTTSQQVRITLGGPNAWAVWTVNLPVSAPTGQRMLVTQMEGQREVLHELVPPVFVPRDSVARPRDRRDAGIPA